MYTFKYAAAAYYNIIITCCSQRIIINVLSGTSITKLKTGVFPKSIIMDSCLFSYFHGFGV